MPSDDPSLDPDGDVAIDDNYQPKDSLINDALSDMLHLPADKQLPGVEIEAEDSEDEDGAGELGGEGVFSGDVNWRWTWWPQEKRKAQKALA